MTISSQPSRRRLSSVREWFARTVSGLTTTGRVAIVVVLAAGWSLLDQPRAASAASSAGSFEPPLSTPLSVLNGFALPSQPWLAGNRGVDLAATTGEPVLAAAAGVVIYAGELAGRGVISISHGTLRTTYEPVDPAVQAGDLVAQGEVIGHVSATADGCGPPGACLHWGARTGDGYVDPMSLLASHRIRLLPIWSSATLPPASPPTNPPAPTLAASAAPAVETTPTRAAIAGPAAIVHNPATLTATAGIAVLAATGIALRGRRARAPT